MKAGLSRRLSTLEIRLGGTVDLGGSIETHFLQGGLSQIKEVGGRPLLPCDEHGVTCAVEVVPIPSMGLRRIIIVDAEPRELG